MELPIFLFLTTSLIRTGHRIPGVASPGQSRGKEHVAHSTGHMELTVQNSMMGEQYELGPDVREGSAWSVQEQLLHSIESSPYAQPPSCLLCRALLQLAELRVKPVHKHSGED